MARSALPPAAEHPDEFELGIRLQRRVVDGAVIVVVQREDEGRHPLVNTRPNDIVEFGGREHGAARKTPLIRVPDHDAVLVRLRQVEAMAVQNCAGPVQGAAGGNGVGDFALRQQLQGFARVFRNCGAAVKKRSIEIENNEFHGAWTVGQGCRAVSPQSRADANPA